MSNELRFDGKVAIVTGAGGGLGRSHALLLGSRGCKVVVNDLGGSMHGGSGADKSPAEKVVAEIKAAGGDAIANYASVENGEQIVEAAIAAYGHVDIVVNNAGILRDVSFQKMTDEDWDLVYRVHVLGSYKVTKAAWNHMRDRGYGRIVMTASAAGIYGNFGQANYAMAKMGLIGFAQTLALEGARKNVLVNTIAPIAGSRLTETILPKELIDALKPEVVSPLVAWLAHEKCSENGGLFEVGGGFFSKLRWERSIGKTFAQGRPVSIEQIEKTWPAITDFGATSHPSNITESMQPVLDNATKKSRGGNEFIDLDQAYGYAMPPLETSHDERDLTLYALGIGAGSNPLDEKELAFVNEMHPGGFQPFPTYGCAPVVKSIIDAFVRGEQIPGLHFGFDRILHGEQFTAVTRPLPASGKLVHKSRVKDIFDKGKHAVIVIETKSYDTSGDLLIENELSMFVRGAGGWGGERGPSNDVNAAPERAPDKTVEQRVDAHQALLYRLNGDRNPLHADPAFAKNFGFDRPILHGLCTFGYVARHAINAFANGDARLFKSIRARFVEPVFPGETLITEMWKEGNKVILRCKVKERDKVALASSAVELYESVPAPKAASKPTAVAAAPVDAQSLASKVDSGALFEVIRYYVEKTPELVGQIKTSFQFNIADPTSRYFIDLKSAPGSVSAGELPGADVTLEISESDFVGMATGALNAQKLYFGGKLKISGNIMASQKLEFLQKMDRDKLLKQMAADGRLPKAAGSSAAATENATTGKPTSAQVFGVIGDYIAETPELVGQVSTVFQFNLKGPDSAWLVDVKNGKGGVTAGQGTADCTLELSDDDFMAMTSGAADPQKLYFAGKLKISGNIMASQKLMFLKKIDAKKAATKLATSSAAGAVEAKPAPAKAKVSASSQVFERLAARLAKETNLASEVNAVLVFDVKDSGKAFTVDLSSAGGAVKDGKSPNAAATFTLSDEALVELATAGNARDIFQRGGLRVDGDVRLAQRLGFMKGLLS